MTGIVERARLIADQADLIERLQSRIEALEAAVKEARLQIQYLHEKFGETGSGNSVLAKLDALTTERELTGEG